MLKLLLILVIQLIYVPVLTLRTISMVKNLKALTALFGLIEAFIYVFGLSMVLSGEQKTIEMIVYAVGFALGLFLGIYIEQKLSIGFIAVTVNINHQNRKMIDELRNKGFGVTEFHGKGKDSERIRLDILTKRRQEKKLYSIIDQFEPNAFIVAYEPKTFKGGYLEELMKKRVRARKKIKTDV